MRLNRYLKLTGALDMKRKPITTVFLSSLLLLSQTQSFAAECAAKSGNKTTPLLELYTSEGCSSCPPADKWISQIKKMYANVTKISITNFILCF